MACAMAQTTGLRVQQQTRGALGLKPRAAVLCSRRPVKAVAQAARDVK